MVFHGEIRAFGTVYRARIYGPTIFTQFSQAPKNYTKLINHRHKFNLKRVYDFVMPAGIYLILFRRIRYVIILNGKK